METHVHGGAVMAKWTIPRAILGLILIAVVAVFLPPLVNLNRFRFTLVHSMEAALGRPVTVGAMKLRLLPQPGLDLQNVVVQEDPAFGAEPMLRADAVTATFRLSSLWRGRLEVARLKLKSGADINPPSLNLVCAHRRWNIEALLQRASQTPAAPTAQPKPEARPRFPYIEAEGGRINFKIGQEKKVYVLNEANFALWLAAENEWAFRLEARPVRTDVSSIDTGLVRISGRFQRAARLQDTPVDIRLSLQNAQLGGLTKLIWGRDRGWRGTVQAEAQLTGTPASLNLTTQAGVSDFRRYDIKAIDPLRLQAQCTAHYSSLTEQLSAINCQMPLGNGWVLLRGDAAGLTRRQTWNLDLAGQTVGLQSLVTLARHGKKDLPDDLTAIGDLDLELNLRRDLGDATGRWSGGGRTSEIKLRSSVLTPELSLPELGFAWEGPGSAPWGTRTPARSPAGHAGTPAALRLVFAPFRLPLGGAGPVTVGASFSREAYDLYVQGEARAPRLLQVGRALGLRVPQYQLDGPARIDLQLAGTWAGFAAPQITGAAQLRNLSAMVRGVNTPVQFAGADLRLDRDAASLQHLTLRFPGSPIQLAGSASLPRNCSSLEQCPVKFDLQGDQISLDELNRLLNPRLAKRAWYNVFSSPATPSVLTKVRAGGHLNANRLIVKSLVAQHFMAEVTLEAGVLTLNHVLADTLGGKYQGTWRADFNTAQPEYSGKGALSGVALPQLAALMHDDWAAGTMDASYQVSLAGSTAGQLGNSLTGAASFQWRDGVLRHLALDQNSGPLQFKNFAGQLEIKDRVLRLTQAQMTVSAGVYEISGTASLARQLGLRVSNTQRAFDVSGSLEKPKVTAVVRKGRKTEATLTPAAPKPAAANAVQP
jgi:uncharacterized protein involved in outer membrane biogenesis